MPSFIFDENILQLDFRREYDRCLNVCARNSMTKMERDKFWTGENETEQVYGEHKCNLIIYSTTMQLLDAF